MILLACTGVILYVVIGLFVHYALWRGLYNDDDPEIDILLRTWQGSAVLDLIIFLIAATWPLFPVFLIILVATEKERGEA